MSSSILLGLTAAATLFLPATSSAIVARHESVTFRGPVTIEANGMSNIHLTYNVPIDGVLSLHYGACNTPITVHKDSHHHLIGRTEVGSHPLAIRNAEWRNSRPEKFVWLVPEDVPDSGCLHAYAGADLIGRSEPITVQKKSPKRSIILGDIADAEGPWFDGVQYLKSKEPGKVFVAQAKSKSIGILGGGMSGLMSAVKFPVHIYLRIKLTILVSAKLGRFS